MGMPSLNWQLQLHLHHIVRHIPVEYLQLWRGLFAGITLLEPDALLLRLKVRGQGTILRMGCFASVCHSPPKPKPKPNGNFIKLINCLYLGFRCSWKPLLWCWCIRLPTSLWSLLNRHKADFNNRFRFLRFWPFLPANCWGKWCDNAS